MYNYDENESRQYHTIIELKLQIKGIRSKEGVESYHTIVELKCQTESVLCPRTFREEMDPLVWEGCSRAPENEVSKVHLV